GSRRSRARHAARPAHGLRDAAPLGACGVRAPGAIGRRRHRVRPHRAGRGALSRRARPQGSRGVEAGAPGAIRRARADAARAGARAVPAALDARRLARRRRYRRDRFEPRPVVRRRRDREGPAGADPLHVLLAGRPRRLSPAARSRELGGPRLRGGRVLKGILRGAQSRTGLATSLRATDMAPDPARIAPLVRQLLLELGEDPDREGLAKTPERVARSLAFLTHGYHTRLADVVNQALFTQDTSSMVIVKDIEVYSLCEHHLLPFFGRCHIGYIPSGKVFGVSKLARLVDMYARRLQLQERLTEQISRAIMDTIGARGVGVMIEAKHLCMMMRGVEKQNSVMVTSSVLGVFRDNLATREEFLTLVGRRA